LRKIAEFVIRFRLPILILIIISSIIFCYGISKIEMYTVFEDLLPPNHPYIKTHQEFRKVFGGANLVAISVEVKNGTIFNPETLKKVKKLTEVIEFTEGVNNYQIFSIARRKVKDIRATAWGIESKPIMFPDVPETEEGLKELKKVIYANDSIYGPLISLDSKAAFIYASFLEEKLDYSNIFNRIMSAAKSLEDSNTKIYVAGEPILYGWIYHYLGKIVIIFAITILSILLLLFVYFRNFQGIVFPFISVFVTAIWGVGFTGFMGYNFDPLVLVIPFLIGGRTISHSVQMRERFFEEYERLGDRKAAATEACAGLLIPGLISIITDAAGVFIIALAPIPILVKIAYVGSFWVLSNIISVLFLDPILCCYFPAPKGVVGRMENDLLARILKFSSRICFGKLKWLPISATILIVVWSIYNIRYLTIGDAHPGSPILWPDSDFNVATKHINDKFPGTEQLIIVVEGKKPDAMKIPEVLHNMEAFQKYLKKYEKVGGTDSVVNLAKKVNMVLHNDNPKWRIMPESNYDSAGLFLIAQESSEPGDFDKWVNYNFKDGNIVVFLKDHKGDTIREVIRRCKEYIKNHPMKNAKYRLAGGYIGIVAGGNEVIAKAHERNLFAILFITFLFCAIAYRSVIAGILFIMSTTIANFTTIAFMAYNNIGMNVNTIPVVTLGVGLGVDYGLYIVSRIMEEYEKCSDLKTAIFTSLYTAGRAVVFTATTITAGIIFWWFSPLRFQAEMGMLLTIVLLLNMLGGMFLLPAIIYIIKPRFVVKPRTSAKFLK
jgi:hypothetical protein